MGFFMRGDNIMDMECNIITKNRGMSYHVYFGSEEFIIPVRSSKFQHALMRVDNALEKSAGDTDKFNRLMITRLNKMTKVDKIINTMVALHVRDMHECLKNHTARLLLELIRNGGLMNS
jgi:hypothetical protein